MLLKAKTSFAGVETMSVGEIKNVKKEIAEDLIRAGYCEEIKEKSSKGSNKK